MLNKIMHKDDIFIPNLNGKLLKGADNVDSIYISPESGDTPTLDYYVATRRMPYGSYHLYLAGHDYRDDPYSLYLFDLMSYIQNGGVLSRLLNRLYQCFDSLFRKWVIVW